MSLRERIAAPGKKKLLAIDGGGIRGVLALEILAEIETILGKGNEDFRLSSYFDYIAGTSTGGIIAAGLSIGMRVSELLDFYSKAGPLMFQKASLLKRLKYEYPKEPLAQLLQQVMGKETRLGDQKLRTLLMLVMRNATTDSPWPISNNPFAKYNDKARLDCNLDLMLWQLVRASAAAPVYFPPEVIPVGTKDFIFVDGGVTMYNNPAFQMFLMATSAAYWPTAPAGQQGWKTGADQMLVVSVGTGTSPGDNASLDADDMNLIFNATTIPSALMYAALNEQDLLCRIFGKCLDGDPLDREVGTLIGTAGPLPVNVRLFTYVRYNAELSRKGLDDMGFRDIDPETVQKLDSTEGIPDLRKIGRKVAENRVKATHFDGFQA